MRKAGRIVARAFEHVKNCLGDGVTTGTLDREIEKVIHQQGGTPAFKNYRGFPASSCISINEEVVHGIPDSRTLKQGDIVSIDIGVCYNKYFGDAAFTFPVGPVKEEARILIQTCRRALFKAIGKIRAGVKLLEISSTIEETALAGGYSVVKKYVGHGIGRKLHEEPQVPNFIKGSPSDIDVVLEEGMALAIEPMMNMGESDVKVLSNGWTVVTADRQLSAHFEHTVLVKEDGFEIFTLTENEETWI